MYEKFYGLTEKPFHIVPNPKFLYLSQKHQNALTYLEYGLLEHQGFILLTGEIGTGKTTLIRHLLSQLKADMEVGGIFNTNVSADQLLGLILREFELPPADNNKAEALDILYQFLIEKYEQNIRVLLIIDEAQNLSDEALEEVRMLSNIHSHNKVLLQIILIGQPELKNKLKSPRLVQLMQRIAVHYHLTELNREETGQYIVTRLKKAGGRPDLFTTKAIDLIYEASKGTPRSINILCDTALVYGFADELKAINVQAIKQVIKDKVGFGLDDDTGGETRSSQILSSHSAANNEMILQRMDTLEARMHDLKQQIDWQNKELDRRAEKFANELINNLKKQLSLQRKSKNSYPDEDSQLK